MIIMKDEAEKNPREETFSAGKYQCTDVIKRERLINIKHVRVSPDECDKVFEGKINHFRWEAVEEMRREN